MVEPTRLRRRRALCSSLLAGVLSFGSLLSLPLRAAEELDIRLDGLDLPLNLAELERWSRDPEAHSGELRVWLSLLDSQSQAQLHQLLNTSLVQQRSFIQQMMRSWAGQRVAEELGVLLSTENGNAGPLVLSQVRPLERLAIAGSAVTDAGAAFLLTRCARVRELDASFCRGMSRETRRAAAEGDIRAARREAAAAADENRVASLESRTRVLS